MEEWELFFSQTPKPEDFDKICEQLEDFCLFHKGQRNLILVTSGGTTVPLERNTVRFVDNFSAGTRGAASTEYFISLGYAVVFLSRDKSIQPYERHLNLELLLNSITKDDSGNLFIMGKESETVREFYGAYREAKENNLLLKISFVSLSDYLWFLRAATVAFNRNMPRSLLYLAAAVSDFYIPRSEMTEHKIQSKSGPLSVTLQIVPKMLKPLVSLWGPNLFIVSFKLETDAEKLISKGVGALQTYKHNLVIGNLLQTRRSEVTFIFRDETTLSIKLTDQQIKDKVEIEELIVREIDLRYKDFLKQ